MLDPEIPEAFQRLVEGFVGPEALPAGGAAGVTTIAMGLALGKKVIRMSSTDATSFDAAATLDSLLTRLVPEFASDCEAFTDLLDALRQPIENAARTQAIKNAWRIATEAPVRVVGLATKADTVLRCCQDSVKRDLLGDLHAARVLIRAGRDIATNNAEQNAKHLDPEIAEHVLATLAT